jgi:hypothetical protein
MSVQRSADELVIWPAVEASWHRNAIRHGSGTRRQRNTVRATRKNRRRLGGHPDTDPHAGLAGTPSRVLFCYSATGQ